MEFVKCNIVVQLATFFARKVRAVTGNNDFMVNLSLTSMVLYM